MANDYRYATTKAAFVAHVYLREKKNGSRLYLINSSTATG